MPLSQFHNRLKAKIEAEVAKVGGEITSGRMTNHEVYRESVGYIRGMIDVLKLADEVEQEMGA